MITSKGFLRVLHALERECGVRFPRTVPLDDLAAQALKASRTVLFLLKGSDTEYARRVRPLAEHIKHLALAYLARIDTTRLDQIIDMIGQVEQADPAGALEDISVGRARRRTRRAARR